MNNRIEVRQSIWKAAEELVGELCWRTINKSECGATTRLVTLSGH